MPKFININSDSFKEIIEHEVDDVSIEGLCVVLHKKRFPKPYKVKCSSEKGVELFYNRVKEILDIKV